MRYKTIKTGAISLCLMILNACSAPPTIVKQPILCPQVSDCGDVHFNIQTNRDLALALNHSINMLRLCVFENYKLKQCIHDYNQTQTGNK